MSANGSFGFAGSSRTEFAIYTKTIHQTAAEDGYLINEDLVVVLLTVAEVQAFIKPTGIIQCSRLLVNKRLDFVGLILDPAFVFFQDLLE